MGLRLKDKGWRELYTNPQPISLFSSSTKGIIKNIQILNSNLNGHLQCCVQPQKREGSKTQMLCTYL